ncbi:MAG: Stp1/IreP family PP2C-type Ser/Thr phosphatase [Anaerolineae bacterium]|nr:Stp1/IreP family PP2C-type Ser/Thr phosphatase [Anaerolineae bacterium]
MNTPGQSGRSAASIKAVATKLTDVGQTRDHNEDSVLISIPADPAVLHAKGALYVVADGMGGYQAGEVASQKAIEVMGHEYFADSNTDLASSLSRAVQKANLAVFTMSQENPQFHGMGTTMVAAVVRGVEVHMANVGDSRGYLLRDGVLTQVTHDHSLVQEQIDAGIVSRENARNLPNRNVITRALGHKAEILVDAFVGELLPGDTLLLCSDGLSGPVHDPDLASILQQYPPEEAVSALIQRANQQGGPDNITALVVRAQPADQFAAVEVAPRAPSSPGKLPPTLPVPAIPPNVPPEGAPSDRRSPALWVVLAVIALLLLVGGGALLWKMRWPPVGSPAVTATLAVSATPEAGQTLSATSTQAATGATEEATATPDKTLKPTSTPVPATDTPTPRPTVEHTAVPDCLPVAPQLASPAEAASKYAGQQEVVFSWSGGQLCNEDQTWMVTFSSSEAVCWPTRDNQTTCTMPSTLGEYQWWVQLWSGGQTVFNVKSASRSLFIVPPPDVPANTPGSTCQPGPKPTDPCAGNWQWDTVACAWTCQH